MNSDIQLKISRTTSVKLERQIKRCETQTELERFLLVPQRFLESWNRVRLWHTLAAGDMCTLAHTGTRGVEADEGTEKEVVNMGCSRSRGKSVAELS